MLAALVDPKKVGDLEEMGVKVKDSEGNYVMTEEQTKTELVTRLRDAASAIDEALGGLPREAGTKFLAGRMERMRQLNRRAEKLLDNPPVKLFSKLG